LATGIAVIACAVMLILGIQSGQLMMTLLALVLLGNLSGFLFFNIHPARVFLGDAGSLFLGFFLSIASVFFVSKTGSLVSLVLPVLALGLPISDTAFAIVRRLIERRPIFAPDKNHLHHRLLDKGYSYRKVVALIHSATLLSALIGLGLFLVSGLPAIIIVFGVAVAPLAFICRLSGSGFRELFASIRQRRRFSRAAQKDLESFLKLQLRLRETKDLTEWWLVIRRAARFLGFSRATIRIERLDKSVQLLHWRNPLSTGDENTNLVATLSTHLFGRQQFLHLKLHVSIEEGLEVAARRLSFFGRLLEDHPLPARQPILMDLRRGPRGPQAGVAEPSSASR